MNVCPKSRLDKLDWWDVVRRLRPGIEWAEFCAFYRQMRKERRAGIRVAH